MMRDEEREKRCREEGGGVEGREGKGRKGKLVREDDMVEPYGRRGVALFVLRVAVCD